MSRAYARPVHELQQQITSADFAELLADYLLEPWGDVRGDIQAGIVASTIAAAHGANLQPSDFMPRWEEKAEEEEQEKVAMKISMVLGGIAGSDKWQ